MNELEPQVQLLDCTLRDSSYAIDFQFSARDTRNICRGLEKAGIRMIEVGHGLGLGASSSRYGFALETDEAYLQAAASALTTASFGAFFIPGIGSKDDLKRAREFGMGFVRVGSELANLGKALEYIAYAKELGLYVALNLMKTYAASPEELSVLAKPLRGVGIDAIYVVDSAGCMLPDQVATYVRALGESSELQVGFHGHNNLGLANANCLAALNAGATLIDGTLRGMGRSAGNAQTEVLVHLLEQAGYLMNVDTFDLFETASRYLEPLMLYPQGLPAMDVVIGMSKFHSSHLARFKRVLDKYDVDLRRLIMAVSQVDCVNPSDELIESIAKDLSRADEFSTGYRRAS